MLPRVSPGSLPIGRILYRLRRGWRSAPVTEHVREADGHDHRAIAPGHLEAPCLVEPQLYLAGIESRGISGQSMTYSKHDPTVADMREACGAGRYAKVGEGRDDAVAGLPDEVLVAHAGHGKATSRQHRRLVLAHHPSHGRSRRADMPHHVGLPDR